MRNFVVCTIHLTVRAIKSRRLRWEGHVFRKKEGRRAFKILRVNLQERDLLGRPRRRLKDNIKMNIK